MPLIIQSADEAITELGGPRKVSRMLNPPVAERAVWNWRQRGFPAYRYPEISELLRRKRLKFTPEVFAGMGKNGR